VSAVTVVTARSLAPYSEALLRIDAPFHLCLTVCYDTSRHQFGKSWFVRIRRQFSSGSAADDGPKSQRRGRLVTPMSAGAEPPGIPRILPWNRRPPYVEMWTFGQHRTREGAFSFGYDIRRESGRKSL